MTGQITNKQKRKLDMKHNDPDSNAKYMPTPDEIALGCYLIRQKWNRTTEQTRLRPDWREPSPEIQTQVPTIKTAGKLCHRLHIKKPAE